MSRGVYALPLRSYGLGVSADDKTRSAAGESGEGPPVAQPPQDDPRPNTLDGDIDMDAERDVPGTGRPDHSGDSGIELADVERL